MKNETNETNGETAATAKEAKWKEKEKMVRLTRFISLLLLFCMFTHVQRFYAAAHVTAGDGACVCVCVRFDHFQLPPCLITHTPSDFFRFDSARTCLPKNTHITTIHNNIIIAKRKNERINQRMIEWMNRSIGERKLFTFAHSKLLFCFDSVSIQLFAFRL